MGACVGAVGVGARSAHGGAVCVEVLLVEADVAPAHDGGVGGWGCRGDGWRCVDEREMVVRWIWVVRKKSGLL